jgi:hypothetical protein
LNQGLNNYGQQSKGFMSSLFGSSNTQQPYNQGTSSFGGRRKRTRKH